MKKMIRALILAAGFTTSVSAFAAANVDGTTITGGSNGECVLIKKDAMVVLSAQVHAAYNCDETLAEIKYAACHEDGSRAQGTATCVLQGTTWSDASCTSTQDTYSIVDYRAFTATSAGGTVAEVALGGRCNDTQVLGLSWFN